MRIYVGNLSYAMSEEELRQVFEDYGQVESATIIMDRDTGQSKGFGFVEMPTESEAQAAIAELNSRQIGGRALTVNEARPRPERSDRGGPRGGREMRGGGGGRRF
jgi:cold-inducible RNA-binding protein